MEIIKLQDSIVAKFMADETYAVADYRVELNPLVIDQILEDAGSSRGQLSRQMGKAKSYISRWCSGQRALTPGDLETMAELLGVEPSAIAGRITNLTLAGDGDGNIELAFI